MLLGYLNLLAEFAHRRIVALLLRKVAAAIIDDGQCSRDQH